MKICAGPVEKFPGRFNHDIRIISAPLQLCRIFLGGNGNHLPVDDNGISFRFYIARKATVDGIILEQVCKRMRVGKIVYSDDFNVFALKNHTKRNAADATETVYGNTNRFHKIKCLSKVS